MVDTRRAALSGTTLKDYRRQPKRTMQERRFVAKQRKAAAGELVEAV